MGAGGAYIRNMWGDAKPAGMRSERRVKLTPRRIPIKFVRDDCLGVAATLIPVAAKEVRGPNDGSGRHRGHDRGDRL